MNCEKKDLSKNELYAKLGYSGYPSKSFNTIISELIKDEIIDGNNSKSPNNKLSLKKKLQ